MIKVPKFMRNMPFLRCSKQMPFGIHGKVLLHQGSLWPENQCERCGFIDMEDNWHLRLVEEVFDPRKDRDMARSDLTDHEVELMGETPKAYKIHYVKIGQDELQEVWVPKSVAEIYRDGHSGPHTMTCPEWKAIELGLV